MSLRSTVFDPAYVQLVGVHKVQRVPSTEKNQRRHSSEVAVVWIPDDNCENTSNVKLDEADLREDFIRTSGPGGQHKNKVSSSVRLTHVPSGVQVVADGERRQSQNRAAARERLQTMIQEALLQDFRNDAAVSKREQFDTTGRVFTWVEWRDEVKSPMGVRASYKNCLKGRLDKLVK